VCNGLERLEAGHGRSGLIIIDPRLLSEAFCNIPHFVASDLAHLIVLTLAH
jgi:hypothetical protein